VPEHEFVKLRCAAETLVAVASGLARYGRGDGVPEWLVSGVWLCTQDADYIATASAEVLASGYVARPLSIDRPDELMHQLQADLPNVSARLIGRNGDFDLSLGSEPLNPPSSLKPWQPARYSTRVLVRISQRQSVTNRVACALLMEHESGVLLVGTDPATLALVLSEDPALIERYRAGCEALSPSDYLQRCGS
jgi:hypothetical protein